MSLSVRYFAALAFVLGLLACSRSPEETTQPPAPTQSVSESPNTPAPAEQPVNSEAPAAAPAPAKSQAAASSPVRVESNRPAPAPLAAASPQPSEARAANTPAAAAPTPAAAVPAPEIVKIPAGTILTVTMIDAVGTDTNKAGDTFTASVAEPVVVNGKTALAKGVKVQGRVQAVNAPGRVQGKAAITLVLTQLVGKDRPQVITTQPFTAEAEASTRRDALKVGGGAGLGAIIGAIAGGKKGAALGAAVGGGAGTAAVLATRGDQIKIDSEANVNFVLKDDVDVELTKSSS